MVSSALYRLLAELTFELPSTGGTGSSSKVAESSRETGSNPVHLF
jgi:hypothetical protein